jgi:hypothetical protein
MSPAAAAALPPADRLRLAVLFGLSWLSLAAARVLVLASDRLTAQARLRLLLEAAA